MPQLGILLGECWPAIFVEWWNVHQDDNEPFLTEADTKEFLGIRACLSKPHSAWWKTTWQRQYLTASLWHRRHSDIKKTLTLMIDCLLTSSPICNMLVLYIHVFHSFPEGSKSLLQVGQHSRQSLKMTVDRWLLRDFQLGLGFQTKCSGQNPLIKLALAWRKHGPSSWDRYTVLAISTDVGFHDFMNFVYDWKTQESPLSISFKQNLHVGTNLFTVLLMVYLGIIYILDMSTDAEASKCLNGRLGHLEQHLFHISEPRGLLRYTIPRAPMTSIFKGQPPPKQGRNSKQGSFGF